MTSPSHGEGRRFKSDRAHMAEEYFVRVENPDEIGKTLVDIGALLRRAESISDEISEIKQKKDDIKEVLKTEIETTINEIERLYKISKQQEPIKKQTAKTPKTIKNRNETKIPKSIEDEYEKIKKRIINKTQATPTITKTPISTPRKTVKIMPKNIEKKTDKASGIKDSIKAIRDEINRLKSEMDTK